MSLYNALFGVNPMAGILLQALGITTDNVPRFRDCYLDEEGDNQRIALYTRTGGGNRDMYECEARARQEYPEYFDGDNDPSGPWNADLRKIDGFIYDEDDAFDSTYATFYFDVPPAFKEIIRVMREISGGAEKPADRFAALIADLKAGEQTPQTERALAVAKPIMEQINAAFSATVSS